jgi:hypothetical protein
VMRVILGTYSHALPTRPLQSPSPQSPLNVHRLIVAEDTLANITGDHS